MILSKEMSGSLLKKDIKVPYMHEFKMDLRRQGHNVMGAAIALLYNGEVP